MFGSNSVFLFRYPQQKRLLSGVEGDKSQLISMFQNEETKEEDPNEYLKAEFYDHEEEENDIKGIDWESAINEMMKYAESFKQQKESEELKAQE